MMSVGRKVAVGLVAVVAVGGVVELGRRFVRRRNRLLSATEEVVPPAIPEGTTFLCDAYVISSGRRGLATMAMVDIGGQSVLTVIKMTDCGMPTREWGLYQRIKEAEAARLSPLSRSVADAGTQCDIGHIEGETTPASTALSSSTQTETMTPSPSPVDKSAEMPAVGLVVAPAEAEVHADVLEKNTEGTTAPPSPTLHDSVETKGSSDVETTPNSPAPGDTPSSVLDKVDTSLPVQSGSPVAPVGEVPHVDVEVSTLPVHAPAPTHTEVTPAAHHVQDAVEVQVEGSAVQVGTAIVHTVQEDEMTVGEGESPLPPPDAPKDESGRTEASPVIVDAQAAPAAPAPYVAEGHDVDTVVPPVQFGLSTPTPPAPVDTHVSQASTQAIVPTEAVEDTSSTAPPTPQQLNVPELIPFETEGAVGGQVEAAGVGSQIQDMVPAGQDSSNAQQVNVHELIPVETGVHVGGQGMVALESGGEVAVEIVGEPVQKKGHVYKPAFMPIYKNLYKVLRTHPSWTPEMNADYKAQKKPSVTPLLLLDVNTVQTLANTGNAMPAETWAEWCKAQGQVFGHPTDRTWHYNKFKNTPLAVLIGADAAEG